MTKNIYTFLLILQSAHALKNLRLRYVKGWVQEGDVSPPAQSTEALAYLYPKSVKKWLSTMYLLITAVWSLTYYQKYTV
jgi:hypothetical protein